MRFSFTKMHGAGNDFIFADDSARLWSTDAERIRKICDRHRGIGADGVILLRKEKDGDPIRMDYYNSDGSPASLCGNGLRCAASFAFRNGLSGGKKQMSFLSGGNLLQAEIMDESGETARVEILCTEPFRPYELSSDETVYKGGAGVPHAIKIVPELKLEHLDVDGEGRRLRFHEAFRPEGTNADFISLPADPGAPVVIRTYERGVEAETLACGTGCAATGMVLHLFFGFPEKVSLLCRGGDRIGIEILKEQGNLKGVFLTGPAKTVFTGEIQA